MSARVAVAMLAMVAAVAGCPTGGGPGNPAKLPFYELQVWLHRLERSNGLASGNEDDIRLHLKHAKEIWSTGSDASGTWTPGCLIIVIPGPRELPSWTNWPARRVTGKNVDGNPVLLGDRFYGDSLPAEDQRVSLNTRYNWDVLIADRNNFNATNRDYQHDRTFNTGTGAHAYYAEQVVLKRFATVEFLEGLAGSRGGAPDIAVLTDETINPLNAQVTLAHELGHILGIRHDDPRHDDPKMLMYEASDVSGVLPTVLIGGITAQTTVEPDCQTTDCGRARCTGRSKRYFSTRPQ